MINNTYSQFIDENEVPEKCIANPREIIYTRTGQVGLVFAGRLGVVHNNCFKVIPNENLLHSHFLYWFLHQDSVKKYANSVASGSVQKDLNHGAFKSIPISIPPVIVQQKIASILSSLDDKIELNRQMNQTLEAMAQTLFQEMCMPKDDELPEGWNGKSLENCHQTEGK